MDLKKKISFFLFYCVLDNYFFKAKFFSTWKKNTMLPHYDNPSLIGAVSFSVCKFASLDSTNIFLKSHINQYPDYTVIIAEKQLGGRGRFNRKWQAVGGKSLTFSIKIPLEKIPQGNWSNITQVMALSVASLIENFELAAQIRWPNDILVGGVKICGILAETVLMNSDSSLILGVGLNVNENKGDFSALDRTATSLSIETGKTFDIEDILEKLLSIFKGHFERFMESGFGDLVGMISDRLYKPEAMVQVFQGTDTFMGRISGITEQGTILIETQTGIVEMISGEITSHIG
ncbi:MAG TPA: biotin--[acetyl-CoA-carboxylase] ligase [Chitinispirillaceae bacterium]|nr:biotin--[acetyl-CoA-carboxylase] ligase [Chitinispirillaceae bacterium]